jgi:hypothetical protein
MSTGPAWIVATTVPHVSPTAADRLVPGCYSLFLAVSTQHETANVLM